MRKKTFALTIGIIISTLICLSAAQATQVFNEAVEVPPLKVGSQGAGGVTFFNGTIVNITTDSEGNGMPITFGDDVRIDGRVFRGATAGTSDSQPFIINDNVEIVGSLIIGSTNVLDSINGAMLKSTYDVGANDKIDTDKLDSGISAALIGGGAVDNTEFGYIDGTTLNIQEQLNERMLTSTYDAGANNMIDTDKLDSGISAVLLVDGSVDNTEFNYLDGVTSSLQTQLDSKLSSGSTIAATSIGSGNISNAEFDYLNSTTSNIQTQFSGKMTTSTYDSTANSAIDADKLDSGISATLIGGGTISNAEFAYLDGTTSSLQTQINAAGDMLQATYDTGANSAIDADKLDSGISAALIGGGAVDNTEFGYVDSINFDNTGDLRLTALGYQTGNSIASTGYRNTLVGYQAGDAISTGTDNTAIGDDALGATTTTANNTAIGSGALSANTDTNNTAIGYDALALSSTGNGNTALGSKALDANTTGDYNTAVGYEALGANTESGSNTAIGYNAMAANLDTGEMNVALGRNALDANTSGSYNVAIGYDALGVNVTASNNTAVGYGALDANTDTDNTAVGYNALGLNVGGTEVTALGSGALDANSSGERGVAVGYNALGANTTGSDNVAIGHSAMADNVGTGQRNVAVGNYALDANTNGVWSTAIGYGALGNGTGLDGNTAVGYLALSAATGDNNTALGYQAGDNITSGGTNLIIGYDVDAASATASNQLNIGDVIEGSVDSSAPRVDIDAAFTFTPSADQARADDSTITIDNGIVRVVGDGGAAVLDTNPAIEDGAADGQMVIIQGTHDVNTVQIADNVNTALAAGGAVTLGAGDTIQLIWDSGDSLWYEVSRSDN